MSAAAVPSGLSEQAFERIRRLIEAECGIVFPPGKRVMIEVRLNKRARILGLGSLDEYCAYLHSAQGSVNEKPHLVDALTTHKTAFFREPSHFDFLVNQAVPALVRDTDAGVRRPLIVWSAACSTGEEPYTIAMVLNEYAASAGSRNFRFAVEASDVSRGTLETAHKGVYSLEDIESIPRSLQIKYLLRSKDRERHQVRICPDLRRTVTFRQINLMGEEYGLPEAPDIVFCRNVMIYFDRDNQYRLVQRLTKTLRPGGYLMMGHAESLAGFSVPLRQIEPTIHRKPLTRIAGCGDQHA